MTDPEIARLIAELDRLAASERFARQMLICGAVIWFALVLVLAVMGAKP